MYELSVIIIGRNEEFISKTVEGVFSSICGNTEVIVGLDETWANPPITDHKDLTIIHYPESIGQRAITNRCVSLSKAKLIIKLDAHCILSEGFDLALLEGYKKLGSNVVQIPILYNLHAFDWVCTSCNFRKYQSPTPKTCEKCNKPTMKREIIWKPRWSRKSEFYRFDTTLHFQYHGQRKKNVKSDEVYPETMSAQGSCFVVDRNKYWEWKISDEAHGSWGQQGTEVACKTWLSGGRLVTNRKCWYSHLFRTQGGDFGFPYPQSGRQVENARKYSRKLFIDNTYDKQIHPLSWLIEKFRPLPDWHEPSGKEMLDKVNKKGEEWLKAHTKQPQEARVMSQMTRKPTKGILYYSDNQLNVKISKTCKRQLLLANLPIVSVTLKPTQFGKNIVLNEKRGYHTMFKQILVGLEALDSDIVFLADHDVLYHPTHFDFVPPKKDVYYYNQYVWRIRVEDGFALHYHFFSGCCAYREFLIKHYKERIRRIEELISKNGVCTTKDFLTMGFEAGTHTRKERIDNYKAEVWESKYPNIDIRHKGNLTSSRWSKNKFRSQRNCRGWEETTVDKIPGWIHLPQIISKFK